MGKGKKKDRDQQRVRVFIFELNLYYALDPPNNYRGFLDRYDQRCFYVVSRRSWKSKNAKDGSGMRKFLGTEKAFFASFEEQMKETS